MNFIFITKIMKIRKFTNSYIYVWICVETFSLGELLYSVEFGTKILTRKSEKLIKKCVNIKLSEL